MKEREIINNFVGLGITEHDALIIADCIVTGKSCSWVNTDMVDEKMMKGMHEIVVKNNYPIDIKIQAIPTRNKFIWDVKVIQKK